jgi:hypothetical protein
MFDTFQQAVFVASIRMKTQFNLLKEKNCSVLKMSECEIFVLLFFTPSKSIWIGNLGTGQKNYFC